MAEFDPKAYAQEVLGTKPDTEQPFDPKKYASLASPAPATGASPEGTPLQTARPFSPGESFLRLNTAATPGMAEEGGKAIDTATNYAERAGNVLGPVVRPALNVAERFISAPARAAIGTVIAPLKAAGQRMRGEPTEEYGMESPLSAISHTMVRGPQNAPTPQQMATGLGMSEEPGGEWLRKLGPQGQEVINAPSAATIGGTIIGAATDPITYMGYKAPIAAEVRGAAKGIGAVSRAAESVAESAGITAPRTVGNITRGIGSKLSEEAESLTHAKVLPDFAETAEVAARAGISPAELPKSVEFGPNSKVSVAESALYEKLGGEALRETHTNALNKVKTYLDSQIEGIGGGQILDETAAGQHLKTAYNDSVKAQMADQADSYKAIAADAGALPVNTDKLNAALDTYEQKANSMMEYSADKETGDVRPVTNSAGQNLLLQVNGVRQNSQNINQLANAISMVGQEAYRVPGLMEAPRDVPQLRQLYKDLRSTFIDNVREVAPDRADALVAHNDRMTNLLRNRELIEDTVKNVDKDPQQQFRAIMRTNVNRVQALRDIVGEDKFRPLKAAFIDSLGRVNPGGNWTFQNLISDMNRNEKFLKEILTPQELAELKKSTDLGLKIERTRGISTANTSAGMGVARAFRHPGEYIAETALNREYMEQLARKARQAAAPPQRNIPKTILQQGTRQVPMRYADQLLEEQRRKREAGQEP